MEDALTCVSLILLGTVFGGCIVAIFMVFRDESAKADAAMASLAVEFAPGLGDTEESVDRARREIERNFAVAFPGVDAVWVQRADRNSWVLTPRRSKAQA